MGYARNVVIFATPVKLSNSIVWLYIWKASSESRIVSALA